MSHYEPKWDTETKFIIKYPNQGKTNKNFDMEKPKGDKWTKFIIKFQMKAFQTKMRKKQTKFVTEKVVISTCKQESM